MKRPRLALFKLSSKRTVKTFLHSPIQFIAIIIIMALGVTLFAGFYSSHLSFKNQVDWIYDKTNIADVWTTVSHDPEKDTPQEMEDDYTLVKDTVGEAGYVEGAFYASAHIRDLNANIILSDVYPTINKCRRFQVKDKKNFFLFSHSYFSNPTLYGPRDEWIDKNGNYRVINVEIEITALKNHINNEKDEDDIKATLDKYKVGETNILDANFLSFNLQPTGTIYHPENVLPTPALPSVFLMSRDFIRQALLDKISSSFNLDQLNYDIEHAPTQEEKERLIRCTDMLLDPIEKLMNKYWCNNRYVTRLNDRNEADMYRKKIDDAFANRRGRDNDLLTNIDLAHTITYRQLNNEINQSRGMCYFLPPAFFVVAFLLVLSTIVQVSHKERNEIGILKSLGATSRSIVWRYIIIALTVVIIGTTIGLVVGPNLIATLMDSKFTAVYSLPKIRVIYPIWPAIGITLFAILTTILITYLVVRREAMANPIDNIRPRTNKIKKLSKRIIKSKKGDGVNKLCLKMSIRNILSNFSRSIMVIVGVFGCTGLLCCGFGVDNSISASANSDFTHFFKADSLMYFTNPTSTTRDELDDLVDNKTINAYEAFGYLPAVSTKTGIINNPYNTFVYSIDTYHESKNHFFDIGYLPHDTKVAISQKVAENLNVGIGNIINFEIAGDRYSGTVEKIVNTFYVHGIFIDGTYPNYPTITKYPTCAFTRYNHEHSEKEIVEELTKVSGIGKVINKNDLMHSFNDGFVMLKYVTLLVKTFALLLALAAIYNLALLSFEQNIQYIATQKVLGFSRREVMKTFFFETMILTTIGTLLGLLLARPFTSMVLLLNNESMFVINAYIAPITFLISFVIIISISIVANLLIFIKQSRVKMVESLKSVE